MDDHGPHESANLVRTALADPAVEQIVQAAARCVARVGFDRTTIDDIVQESGVPRTTVYRKVGSRDAILRALLVWMARPQHEVCRKIAMGPGSLAERVERVIASNVASISNFPWLKAMLQSGLSRENLALFQHVNGSQSETVLRPMLAAAADAGEWTPPAGLSELMDWLLRQILMLGSEDRSGEAELRDYVRTFIIPVFGFERKASPDDIEERLAAIEKRLSQLTPWSEQARSPGSAPGRCANR